MENKKILLLGGGGHCRSVLDCLLSTGEYDEIGLIGKEKCDSHSVLGVSVVGTDDDLQTLYDSGWKYAFVTLGSVGNTNVRHKLYNILKEIGFILPSIIDNSAIIGRETEISSGAFVGKRAIVNAGSTVGVCAIINTGAIIEHDCKVGDFCHISPGTILCGEVKVGDDSHVGAGSVVRQQIIIGSNSVIGAGSVVVKDVDSGITAYGNPCKVGIKK